MTNWIRTDFDYYNAIPMARFCLGTRQVIRLGNCDLRGVANEKDPELMRKIVEDLIEEFRPDLMGGFLLEIKYDLMPMRWEFTYCHRSLPKTKQGERPSLLNLIPEPGMIEFTETTPIEQASNP